MVLNVQKSVAYCFRRMQAFKQIIQKTGYWFNVVKCFPPHSMQPIVGFFAENFPVFSNTSELISIVQIIESNIHDGNVI